MKMKKKKIKNIEKLTFILLISVSIIFAGCSADKISDEEKLQAAIFNAQNNGVQECGALSNKLKQTCIDEYYMLLAVNEHDNSICDKASANKKTECLDQILMRDVMESHDTTLCNDIKTQEIKGDCINKISEFKSQKYFNAVMNEAINTKDITKCDSLSEFEVVSCRDSYYFTLSPQNSYYCNKIQNENIRQLCIELQNEY